MSGPFEESLRELEAPEIPGYTVEGELGRGGHSTVYRARSPTGEEVAIKRWLAPELGQAARQRIEREAEALRALDHPHVARFVELTEDAQGRPCLVLELVRGASLAHRLDDGPLDPDVVLDLGLHLARTLEAVAELGLVHRDLKPSNVILRDGTTPVLIDFSIVKPTAEPEAAATTTLTEAGAAIGSSPYMAPEQCAGELGADVDPRTDVYGLGALLFHALTGHPPWAAESAWERQQRNPWRDPYPTQPAICDAIRARHRLVPAGLGRVIATCLEGRVERRPVSARALRQQLEATTHPSAASRWALGILGLTLCGLSAYEIYDRPAERLPSQGWRTSAVTTTTPTPSRSTPTPASPAPGEASPGERTVPAKTLPKSPQPETPSPSASPSPAASAEPRVAARARRTLQRLVAAARAWDLEAAGALFAPRVFRAHRDLRPRYRAESVARPARRAIVAQIADALATPGLPLASLDPIRPADLSAALSVVLPKGGVRATLGRPESRSAMELYFDPGGRITCVASIDRDPKTR